MNRLQSQRVDVSKDYRAEWQSVIFEGQLGRASVKTQSLIPMRFPKIKRNTLGNAGNSILMLKQDMSFASANETQLASESQK